MRTLHQILHEVQKHRLIGILRKLPVDRVEEVGKALFAGGLRLVEVTLDSPGAQEMIERLRALSDKWYVGTGTVLDEASARCAVLAGAQFLVTPTVSLDVIRTGSRYGLAVITGAMTPSEILTAYEAGSAMVKVFPAGSLGPAYIKQVRGPLSYVPLVAVGGVNAANARKFLEAGCVAVGVGSSLVTAADLASGSFDAMRENVSQLVAAVS